MLVTSVGPGSGQCGFYRSSLSCTSSQGLSGVSPLVLQPLAPGMRGKEASGLSSHQCRECDSCLTITNHTPRLPLCINSPTWMSDKAHKLNVHCCTNSYGSQAGFERGGRRGRSIGIDECMSASLEWVGRPGVRSPLKRLVTPQHQRAPAKVEHMPNI